MPILIYISWICYAGAALCLVAVLNTESFTFLVPAISAAIAGVLFAALERIIDTLTDIRDVLVQGSVKNKPRSGSTENLYPPEKAPEPALKKLDFDKIDRLKE